MPETVEKSYCLYGAFVLTTLYNPFAMAYVVSGRTHTRPMEECHDVPSSLILPWDTQWSSTGRDAECYDNYAGKDVTSCLRQTVCSLK